jgi:glycolate oxidase FAD binding subunit
LLHFQLQGQLSAGTVGGMVASGLSGPARASVGAVRDFVLGMRFINGHGEHLTLWRASHEECGRLRSQPIVGGQLGNPGLDHRSFAQGSAHCACRSFFDVPNGARKALQLLNQWGGQPLPLNASCWVKDATLAGAPDMLFLRLRGAQAAVEAAKTIMAKDVSSLGSQLIEQDVTQAAEDWHAARHQTLPFFRNNANDLALWRFSVPQTAPVLTLPSGVSAPFIEWHGAQRSGLGTLERGPNFEADRSQCGRPSHLVQAATASKRGRSGRCARVHATRPCSTTHSASAEKSI